jgi:flagellar biosynthetic protein FliO
MLQQLLAVFLVLGLLLAALWLLRRKGLAKLGGGPARNLGRTRQMEVVERIPLTAQHSLHLVSLAGRFIVVGVSPSGCSRIATFRAVASVSTVLEER